MIGGGCACGAVRYTLDYEAMPGSYACHCTICQRATGSSFAHQMPVREAALEIMGETVTAQRIGLSGHLSTSFHCAKCLSRLYNVNAGRPGIAIVRAGTVDGGETLSPRLHIFTSTKQPWVVIPEGVEAYAESAPLEAWGRLFG